MPFDRAAVRALFDQTIRRDPPPEDGVRSEWDGDVLRLVGPHCCIDYSELTDGSVAASILRQVEFVRRTGKELEWKVYEHDRPVDLADRLRNAGFVADPAEVLVAHDLSIPLSTVPPWDVEVRQVDGIDGLEEAVVVGVEAFGDDPSDIRERLEGRLSDPTMALFVAYSGGRAVSAGRLEMPPGRPFASLWGGGTVPAFRGRGIYSALVAARSALALERGYRYVTVDARDATSRPILERLGFERLAGVVGWVLTPAAAGPP